jgi:hypothetical protein
MSGDDVGVMAAGNHVSLGVPILFSPISRVNSPLLSRKRSLPRCFRFSIGSGSFGYFATTKLTAMKTSLSTVF